MFITIFCAFVVVNIVSVKYAAGSSIYSTEEIEAEQLWITSSGENIESRRFLSDTSDVLPNRTDCGLDNAHLRIFSGTLTHMKEFPWMAALEFRNRISKANVGIKCGGSVINRRYILTAAHCISDPEFEITSVRLGEWNLTDNPDCQGYRHYRECADSVKFFSIEDEIVYPTYGPISGRNDIGLLRLNKEIHFSDYIKPICLPSPNQPVPEQRSLLTVAGWGLTEHGYTSHVKLKVEVPIMSIDDCHNILGSKYVTEYQLCVGGVKGKDSCTGDSGGPLMRPYADTDDGNIQWYQEGIVSYGHGCGVKDTPAIYTRVSHYRNWIIETISKRSLIPTKLLPRQPELSNSSDTIFFFDEETNTFQ